jgi:hypothetical protein
MPLLTDPIDLLLDDNNDLVFRDGDLVFSTGIEAVVQACRIVMQMFRGEWFLNLDAGLPYWESILGQKPAVAIQAATMYIRRELELVDGVVDVTKLEVTYVRETRMLKVEWQVDTEFGETPSDTIELRVATGGE